MFVNTMDKFGDDETAAMIIERTITEYCDDTAEKIGPYAFYGCKELTEVNVPNVTDIGGYAFSGCTAIQTITLPEVVKLGEKAFDSSAAPCIITLPKWITNGSYPFYGSGIKGIIAPVLKSLSDSTFRAAYSLVYADFASLTSITGNYVFQWTALKTLILRSSTLCALSAVSSFSDSGVSKGTGYVYVPRSLIESYKTATNWSTYATQFRALEDYTVDGTITGELDETKI